MFFFTVYCSILQCRYCPEAFWQPQKLDKHVDVVHREFLRALLEKKYSCLRTDCGMEFSSEAALANHQRTWHNGKALLYVQKENGKT